MNTTLLVLALSAVFAANPADVSLDAKGFLGYVHGLYAPLEDVSFIYECQSLYVGPKGLRRDDGADLVSTCQGAYAYRASGDALLDFYQRTKNTLAPMLHQTEVLFHNDLTTAGRTPDLKKAEIKTSKARTNRVSRIGTLNLPNSPQRIFRACFFQTLKDPTLYDYRQIGWEDLDGHRCLVVRFDVVPGLGAREGKPYNQYWIDVERGGHSIKIEQRQEDKLYARTTVELERFFLTGGKTIWFPTRGKEESFRWEDRVLSEPVLQETCKIVDGTLLFNQGLGDEVFTVEGARKLRQVPALASAAREYDLTPPKPKVRNDYESVQKRIDDALGKANDQTRVLDATRADASEARWEMWPPILLALAGVMLLGIAGWVRLRRR